jgi:hypothetical protein
MVEQDESARWRRTRDMGEQDESARWRRGAARRCSDTCRSEENMNHYTRLSYLAARRPSELR